MSSRRTNIIFSASSGASVSGIKKEVAESTWPDTENFMSRETDQLVCQAFFLFLSSPGMTFSWQPAGTVSEFSVTTV